MRRVGGTHPIKIDVRVVAATNRDLRAMVSDGRFRDDLYYRINVLSIDVPPLRDRREDIPVLIDFFLKKHTRNTSRLIRGLTPDARKVMLDYAWPGNVRQLENVVARALALNVTGVLGPRDFPEPIGDAPKKLSGLAGDMPSLAELSRRYAAHVLQHVGGNKSEAARLLGVDRKTLYKLLEAQESAE